ncbi:MAG: hypothetical protein AAGK97_06740 [Bacteroidota bacterium]
MTHATAVELAVEVKTCSNCPYFQNHNEPEYLETDKESATKNPRFGCGWCGLFDHQAKIHHEQTQDCINSSDLQVTHEKEDNLRLFPNLDSDAFPTKEVINEADLPHTEYQVGSVVKVIDPDEHHTEWAVFEVIECKHNKGLYRNTETYLNETSWYFRLASHDDATIINEDLWVREDEICHFEQSHLICTEEIF